MANSDAAFGLRPVRYTSGAPYNGAVNKYYIPDTDSDGAYYPGGLVKLAGSADADGIPTVTGNVSTGDGVIGVIVSVVPDTADSLKYRADDTARYVLVADDPDLIFQCQEDGAADADAILQTEVGMTADLTGITSGDTTYGRSTTEISSSTATSTYTPGTTDTDVEIVRLAQIPGNEIGAFAVWEVRLLNHIRGATYNRFVGV